MPGPAGLRAASSRSSALSSETVDALYDFALTVTWSVDQAEEAVRTGLRSVDPDTADVADLFHHVRLRAIALARPDRALVDVDEELPTPDALPVPLIESIALPVIDSLDPADRAVLDLAFRRGLEGDELAAAIGVPPSIIDDAVREAAARADHALGHYVLARIGHDTCPRLRDALGDPPPERLAEVATRVDAHLEECSLCTDRREGFTPVTTMLDAVPARPAPEELKEALAHLWDDEEVEAAEALMQRRRLAGLLVVLAVVAVAGVLIGIRQYGSGGGSGAETTETTLPRLLAASGRAIDLGAERTEGSIDVRNVGDHRVSFRVQVDVPWLAVAPAEGTVRAGERATLSLTIDRSTAPEGRIVTTVRVLSSGAPAEFDVAADIPKGPEVAGVVPDPGEVSVAPCDQAPTTATLRSTVHSVSAIQSVVAKTSQGDVPMTLTGAEWTATLGPYSTEDDVKLTVVATDAIGKTATSPEVTVPVNACPEPPRRGRR